MWFVEWLISIVTYPIYWFWKKASAYREEGKKGSIILLFTLSLTGVLLFVFVLIRGSIWLWTNHIEIVIGLGLIIWLYSYIYSRTDKNPNQKEQEKQIVSQVEAELWEQAEDDYPRIRTIIYKTLKGSADTIGGERPISDNEIVFTEGPYMIANGLIFYQFQLVKHDIKMRYEKAELAEYARVLQNDIARKIRAGDFPELSSDKIWHNDGKSYHVILIDGIEDMDNCFYIRVVRFSPMYVEYRKKIAEHQRQDMTRASDIPTVKWEGKR